MFIIHEMAHKDIVLNTYLSLSISSSSLANRFLSSSLRELPTIFWSDGFSELSP